MPMHSPDIETFKQNLDAAINSIKQHKTDSHSAIKIQAMLNVTIYVMATRFLEGSVKHIVYNCCKMKGYTSSQLSTLEQNLKGFNNPEFSNIRDIFLNELNFDIIDGKNNGQYSQSDITFLNQIVQNRHRNVHASSDSTEWYNQNKKDLSNFLQEYPGMVNIIEYLSSLTFTSGTVSSVIPQTSSPQTVPDNQATSNRSIWEKVLKFFSNN